MQDLVETDWKLQIREHLSQLRNYALVGNMTEATRQLEAMGDVIIAAAAVGELPAGTFLEVKPLVAQLRPHIVLRRETMVAAIVANALAQAGVMNRRPLAAA